ncbi:MAG: GNAT family N-acetyltransferase [Candidatus Doudnabacteria bacterium]|nr:GNAT family N-acetyltransferase [Candidatus Doudnabacteria bacterium]
MHYSSVITLTSVAELRELVAVFSSAFEAVYTVTDEYLQAMVDNPAVVVLGVREQEIVVGGLVAFEMTPIHGAKEFYIYDIAVHPEYQKRGIGKLLMEKLSQEGKARGVQTMFVEAESEDVGAVAFYRAIGGEEVSVNHFNFNL